MKELQGSGETKPGWYHLPFPPVFPDWERWTRLLRKAWFCVWEKSRWLCVYKLEASMTFIKMRQSGGKENANQVETENAQDRPSGQKYTKLPPPGLSQFLPAHETNQCGGLGSASCHPGHWSLSLWCRSFYKEREVRKHAVGVVSTKTHTQAKKLRVIVYLVEIFRTQAWEAACQVTPREVFRGGEVGSLDA